MTGSLKFIAPFSSFMFFYRKLLKLRKELLSTVICFKCLFLVPDEHKYIDVYNYFIYQL